MQWIVPILSLVGALFGGSVSGLVSHRLAERRVDTDLVRDARIALECWYATRSGPWDPQYDGIDPELLKNISDRTLEDFFKRYFVAVASSLFGDI